jgi:hypothetical protein
MIRAVATAILLALAGCGASLVPYNPDRTVARSIPADRAQEGLRAALSRGGCSGVVVDALHFEFVARYGRYSSPYALTRVGIYVLPAEKRAHVGADKQAEVRSETSYAVLFTGGTPTRGRLDTTSREDAETIADAITSLGGNALSEEKK